MLRKMNGSGKVFRKIFNSPKCLFSFITVALFLYIDLYTGWPLTQLARPFRASHILKHSKGITEQNRENITEKGGGNNTFDGDMYNYQDQEAFSKLRGSENSVSITDTVKAEHDNLESGATFNVRKTIDHVDDKTGNGTNRTTQMKRLSVENDTLVYKRKFRVKDMIVTKANLSKYAKSVDVPNVKVTEASCFHLFNHWSEEIKRANVYQKIHPKVAIPDVNYTYMTENCEEFKIVRKYITKPVNEEEEKFSLAFSILIYRNIEMLERLLRAIYRPQNFYCIHVDAKSDKNIHNGIKSIADCFDNVFVSSRVVDIEWALYNVLEADLICMEDLWKRSTKWKYFINLTGEEFPLRTNFELVQILKVFNGANNVAGSKKRYNTAFFIVFTNRYFKQIKGLR